MEFKKRLYNVDFLRIVLINAILIHHFKYAATGHWNTGDYAVEFFFIIAGFFFNLTFKIQKTTIDFIIGKLIRYMPLLICTSLTYALCTKFNVQRILADLFLLQKTGLYTPNTGFGYDAPAWFISLLFWILLFIFYLRKSTNEKITNLVLGVITFASLFITTNGLSSLYPNSYVARAIAAIGIGYFCYELVKVLPQTYIQTKSKLVTLFEISLFSYFSYIIFATYEVTNKVGIMFLMGILVILFYYQKGYFTSFLNRSVFTKISCYVFPLYLTHSVFYEQSMFFKYLNQTCNNTLTIYITGVILSWMLGVFAYHLIEQPVVKYLTKRYNEAKTRTEDRILKGGGD